MIVPDWMWYPFLLAFGCCVGSFLNVVIYRLPREKSLVTPPSACPSCGRHIRFYDNIPLLSWLVLRGKCRYCSVRISPRYFVIELLTGLSFIGLYWLYFESGMRHGVPQFADGGWLIYLTNVVLVSGLIAASAIDLELWVIPLSICWFMTGAGFVGSATAPLLIDPQSVSQHFLLPTTTDVFLKETTVASMAAGALVGTALSLVLLCMGVIRRSYDSAELEPGGSQVEAAEADENINHRAEAWKEIVFLLPIVAGAACFTAVVNHLEGFHNWWLNLTQRPIAAGFLGSLWGYFIGCAVVWVTRLLGTFCFGKEAMGLGDVHLMGAAGAVIGSTLVVVAFFIAPFFGLAWASVQMFFKKTRQIPYGPFLSLGILVAIILHDRILDYTIAMLYP